jgi:DNA anti-recombination protein RmuC
MKYRNTSGLKQIAIINGKKEIVPNGVVIEVEKEFIHPAFERVDEDTQATFKKLVPKFVKNDTINSLQKQLSDIQQSSEGLASSVSESISKQLEELSQRLSQVETRNEIETLTKMCEEKFTMVFKRLEILKNAVQTIELEVDQALYGEEGDTTKSR